MRLKTPTQAVMTEMNWGNIHMHFFALGIVYAKRGYEKRLLLNH